MSLENQNRISDVAESLAECGKNFYQRGWVLGTSGNFSAVVERDPLRLLITASGNDKGQLTPDHFVEVNDKGVVVAGAGKPSDETRLHLTLINQREAASVLHTHSVWSTLLSNAHFHEGGIKIAGWEMLKGLAGVKTHQHNEWLPILDNSQNMSELAKQLSALLNERPNIHGFLLRGHGLYTWGASIQEAKRHIEILEFLLEVTGRTRFGN
jgi:methylthioribulose-1-phosphate dehydratase